MIRKKIKDNIDSSLSQSCKKIFHDNLNVQEEEFLSSFKCKWRIKGRKSCLCTFSVPAPLSRGKAFCVPTFYRAKLCVLQKFSLCGNK